MHAQTPVQIAWVTKDLDATEKALSTLLGAKKWIRVRDVHFGRDTCTYRGRPADFVAHISFSYAGETQLELIAPVSGESIYTEFMPGGIRFAYVTAEAAGVPYIEIAYISPEIRAFFDYVKQEQQQ
jgi:Glyoxalase/Bleomycin resistance protein/Dioxygenase superfamily